MDEKTSFEVALTTLRQPQIDGMLKALHEMFGTIVKMTPDEVVVAYQTLETCKLTTGDLGTNPVFRQIKRAILDQMARIVSLGNLFGPDAKRFTRITGGEFRP